MNYEEFEKFLELSENERYEHLTKTKLHWWGKLYIKFINKWWTFIRKDNMHLGALTLWESIRKGRF